MIFNEDENAKRGALVFDDASLKRYLELHGDEMFYVALISRLEAAEIKDCNQYHCGHATCNTWRKAAGK